MKDQLRTIQYAIKATHGDICANHGCWGRVEEGTLCPECDKRRHDDEIDAIMENNDD